MWETSELPICMENLNYVQIFNSNLPPGGGFLILDANLAACGSAISHTCLAGMIGTSGGYSLVINIFLIIRIPRIIHIFRIVLIIIATVFMMS